MSPGAVTRREDERLGCGAAAADSAASHAHGFLTGGQGTVRRTWVACILAASAKAKLDAMATASVRCMPKALAVELQFCNLPDEAVLVQGAKRGANPGSRPTT